MRLQFWAADTLRFSVTDPLHLAFCSFFLLTQETLHRSKDIYKFIVTRTNSEYKKRP